MTDQGRRVADKMNPFSWINGNTPWWAKLLVFCCFWLGPSLMFALVFIAIFIGAVPSPITQNRDTLTRLESLVTRALLDMQTTIEKRRIQEIEADRRDLEWKERLLHIGIEWCRAASRNEQQMSRCDYLRR